MTRQQRTVIASAACSPAEVAAYVDTRVCSELGVAPILSWWAADSATRFIGRLAGLLGGGAA